MKTGSARDPLSQLLAGAHGFSFFQAMRLLHQACRRNGKKTASPASIRVRPKLSLGFPAADIDRITIEEEDGRRHFAVTANFLGIYGVSSPLPSFYTEDLIEERSQDESVSRDFLDIFNHRLYDLLFACWRKYRLSFQVIEDQDQAALERLFCLMGLGAEPLRHGLDDPWRLLRYLGLFTQFPRSAAGLAALLSDAIENVPITIVPCVPRKAQIASDQRFCLGKSNCRLGGDSYLGNQIEDRMGKFRLRIGPLDQTTFLNFTPGNQGYHQLAELTALYLNQPLECEAELVMAPGEAKSTCLGVRLRASLGVTTWIFSGPTISRQVAIRFSVTQPQPVPAGAGSKAPAPEERTVS